ncbi:MAG: starch-binding protein [Muribaculaceae bacterium]|nr:starch-binding protein [Muribaculaceae bacterium]
MMNKKRMMPLLAVVLLPLLALAQGWPANYGGVMLQGFYWNSFDDTKWSNLTAQADELGDLFDLIWVPNSGRTDPSGTSESMGYSPMYWLSHTSCFGTEQQLRTMIDTYRQHGTGILMDLVLNHKNGKSGWVDFADEHVSGRVSGKTYDVRWENVNFSQICSTDECNSKGYKTTGAPDTGDDFDGSRDLDHTNITTQQNVRTYMDFLQNELGYSGYRLDMTKGYSPGFTGKYNNWTHPYFCVGEYWDGNADVLRGWLEATRWGNQIQSATFDYALKYRINDAFNGSSFNSSALNDKGLCADVWYNRWAITFVDNHDTGQVGNHSRMSNDSHVAAANALILALPGTPCVFLQHYKNNKTAIANMIRGRRAAGITNQSPITVQQESNGGYIIEVQGSQGKVYLQLGDATTSAAPTGYQLVQSGNNYKYFVTSGLDWRTSTKRGGGVPPSLTPTPVPDNSKVTIYVKAGDQSSTHLYAWDTSGQPIGAAWPGTPIRTLPFTYVAGAKWYYKTFDQATVNVIFNNGTGGETNQTADIKNLTTSSFFTYSGTDYTDYKNVTAAVKPYIDYEIPTQAAAIDGHLYCYLETGEWTAPNIYMWDNNGKQWTGAWTGKKMTLAGTSPTTGNKIWLWDGGEATEDGRPDYLVFNDSKDGGAQTEDMDFVNGGYYTLYGLLGSVANELAEPDSVFVMGEVDGVNGWYADKGLLMSTSDGHTYTATITTRGLNSGYSYFSFTKKLATTATDWEAIADYRFGAEGTTDYVVNASNLGQPLPLGDDGTSTAFKIGAGTWTLTLDLTNRTLTVAKPGEVVKPGDVTGDGNVDIDDVNALINHILGKTLINPVTAGDLNSDGIIDIDDVNAIINIILSH